MAVKSRRIALRTDPESEALLVETATVRRQSMSSFILSAALHEADLVLARADATSMPAAQFDAFIASLDQADEAAGSARSYSSTRSAGSSTPRRSVAGG